ncbi:hypothetical protein [Roseiflexus castenholzii]|jgi:hypothetical protein|uniref:hypothetical protein n=1 Tax=Roseiflexus castenholzii TaxID=120962 RepID=UPI00059C1510|nr:hypothetical protein [Roseiflexus castenholzii]
MSDKPHQTHIAQRTPMQRVFPLKWLIGERLVFDRKIVAITVISLILLAFDNYRSITPFTYWDRVVRHLIIPLLVIIVIFREHPRCYGFTLGDWKAGLVLTLLGAAIMAPILYVFGQRDPARNAYYRDMKMVYRGRRFSIWSAGSFCFADGFYSLMRDGSVLKRYGSSLCHL